MNGYFKFLDENIIRLSTHSLDSIVESHHNFFIDIHVVRSSRFSRLIKRLTLSSCSNTHHSFITSRPKTIVYLVQSVKTHTPIRDRGKQAKLNS